MTKYRLVQCLELDGDHKWITTDFDEDNAAAALEVRGFKLDETRVGGNQLREELRGKPVFDGLAGPMWGGVENGDVIVRYEDWKAYEVLSA
jgi:hypothetical protein